MSILGVDRGAGAGLVSGRVSAVNERLVRIGQPSAADRTDAESSATASEGGPGEIASLKGEIARLKEVEANYRGMFENALDGIFQTTPAGRYLNVNPALARIYGYGSPAELIATLNDIEHQLYTDPRRRPEFVRLMERDGLVDRFESQIRRKDGGVIWISESARCVRDPAGRLLYYEGIVKDVTERMRTEEKLREQAALLDQAHDAIYVPDLDHCVRYWNEGATRLYGWTRAEACGQSALRLFWRGDEAPVKESLQVVRERGEWTGELRQFKKDGKEIFVQSRWALMRDAAGLPRSILVINTDVTERKRLEAQFLRAQRMESIGTLTSGVAHDLNNCLTPILISAPLLRCALPPEQLESTLTTIEVSAQRGADIIRQLLTFVRGAEGRRGPVQLRHIVSETVAIARQTFPKSILVKPSFQKDLWIIQGDPTQLHQVLVNLCVNARDAMPRGGTLAITARNVQLDSESPRRAPQARPGPHVIIEVTDTGEGIAPEILDRIFDPFFTTKESGRGTGLGLSTVLSIVKSHGGFIEVRTEVGKGTTFTTCLPATPEKQLTEARAAPAGRAQGKGELILLVEDETGIREITQLALTSNNYQVMTASDGFEAVALFTKHGGQIKLVLTDLMMPFMDGSALVRILRKMNPHIPIVVMTGAGARELEPLAGLDIQRVLAKPYTSDKLLAMLREVFSV